MVAAIVCFDKNYGIGKNGSLLFRCKEDMKHFKSLTEENVIVAGRKTYESFDVKPLPNRTNIVVTRGLKGIQDDGSYACDLEEAKELLEKFGSELGIYIVGGGQIYKELLPYCDFIYATEVDFSFDNVDTYFPNLSEMPEWEKTKTKDPKVHNGYVYRYCTYRRK